MNSTEQKVYKFICEKKLVDKQDTVIVGLSGGADSVCLIMILNELKSVLDISLKAVHINHGIRGEAADEDEQFARDLCDRLGIEYISYKRDIPLICTKTGETEEECGRRIRYEIFREEAGRVQNSKIAVAHHMNDQTETILFRLARGTGIKGLAGMKPQNGNIIRPLLCLSREEIEDYMAKARQDYRTDATNEELLYSRNYIRKKIVPDMELINSEAVKHICTLSDEVQSVMDYMDECVDDIISKASVNGEEHEAGNNIYDAKVIYSQSPILRSYTIRRLIEDQGLSLKDIHREHIEGIVNILMNSESTRINLPRQVVASVENGKLKIGIEEGEQESAGYCHNIEGDCEVDIDGEFRVKCRVSNDFDMDAIPRNTYTKWFDYDKIQNGLCIRNRRKEDYIVINAEGNTRKLSDYMIDRKIPKGRRNLVPIIASGSHVVWVVGHRISEDVKVTDKTTRIIEIIYERKE